MTPHLQWSCPPSYSSLPLYNCALDLVTNNCTPSAILLAGIPLYPPPPTFPACSFQQSDSNLALTTLFFPSLFLVVILTLEKLQAWLNPPLSSSTPAVMRNRWGSWRKRVIVTGLPLDTWSWTLSEFSVWQQSYWVSIAFHFASLRGWYFTSYYCLFWKLWFPLLSTPYSELMTLFHLSLILLKQSGENLHIFHLPNLKACPHLFVYLPLSFLGNSVSSKATFLCTGSHLLNDLEVSFYAYPLLPIISLFFIVVFYCIIATNTKHAEITPIRTAPFDSYPL